MRKDSRAAPWLPLPAVIHDCWPGKECPTVRAVVSGATTVRDTGLPKRASARRPYPSRASSRPLAVE